MRMTRTVIFGTALIVAAAFAAVSAQQAPAAPAPPANPAHTHIGHVMTSWKDTPNMTGFLPAAAADAPSRSPVSCRRRRCDRSALSSAQIVVPPTVSAGPARRPLRELQEGPTLGPRRSSRRT